MTARIRRLRAAYLQFLASGCYDTVQIRIHNGAERQRIIEAQRDAARCYQMAREEAAA